MDWIKVTPETMPNRDGFYLCSCERPNGERFTTSISSFYDTKNGFYYMIGSKRVGVGEGIGAKVTHWMPLPKPAEED